MSSNRSSVRVPYAYTESRRLITAGAAQPCTDHACPECEQRVRRRAGQRTPHFYHLRHTPRCAYVLASQTGEGIQHLNSKYRLKRLLDGLVGHDAPRLNATVICHACQSEASVSVPLPSFDSVVVEKAEREAGIKPDITLLRDGSAVFAFEIRDTHAVDSNKAERMPCPWLEVSASYGESGILEIVNGTIEATSFQRCENSGCWVTAEYWREPPPLEAVRLTGTGFVSPLNVRIRRVTRTSRIAAGEEHIEMGQPCRHYELTRGIAAIKAIGACIQFVGYRWTGPMLLTRDEVKQLLAKESAERRGAIEQSQRRDHDRHPTAQVGPSPFVSDGEPANKPPHATPGFFLDGNRLYVDADVRVAAASPATRLRQASRRFFPNASMRLYWLNAGVVRLRTPVGGVAFVGYYRDGLRALSEPEAASRLEQERQQTRAPALVGRLGGSTVWRRRLNGGGGIWALEHYWDPKGRYVKSRYILGGDGSQWTVAEVWPQRGSPSPFRVIAIDRRLKPPVL